MPNLEEVIKLDVGKTSNDIFNFIGKLILKKEVEVYSISLNRREILEDNDDFTIIKFYKGFFLEEIENLIGYSDDGYVLEDVETNEKYILNGNSRGRVCTGEKDIYYNTTLTKLNEKFDSRKIHSSSHTHIDVPDEMKGPNLHSYYIFYADSSSSGYTELKGEKEPTGLFKKVMEHIKN
jgi:hypothetical protein